MISGEAFEILRGAINDLGNYSAALKREEMQGPKKICRDRGIALKNVLAGLMVLLLLLGFFMKGSWAGLAISPAYVEVSLDEGRPAGQFIISNLGEEEERYRIRAVHFTFLKDGGVRRIEPDKNSLAPWIKFNPTEFTLGPNTKRAIRYVIIPPANLKAGEYWAAMELESLKTSITTGKDEDGREYQFEVIPSILVPMFGKFGKVRYGGILKEIKVAPNQRGQAIHLLVGNTGEGKLVIEGRYEVRNSLGEEVQRGSWAKAYVLPRSELIFSSQLGSNLAEGTYRIRVECHSPQLKESLTNEFQLVWKPPSR